MMTEIHTLADALRAYRAEAGLNQRDFAERLGVKQPQLARYEKGQIPDGEMMIRIAAVVGLSVVIRPDGSVRFE